jgi:hypothetical protein
MSTQLKDLKKLTPTKFPGPKGSKELTTPVVAKAQGKSTREVVAEMRRLSKKGIYVAE